MRCLIITEDEHGVAPLRIVAQKIAQKSGYSICGVLLADLQPNHKNPERMFRLIKNHIRDDLELHEPDRLIFCVDLDNSTACPVQRHTELLPAANVVFSGYESVRVIIKHQKLEN